MSIDGLFGVQLTAIFDGIFLDACCHRNYCTIFYSDRERNARVDSDVTTTGKLYSGPESYLVAFLIVWPTSLQYASDRCSFAVDGPSLDCLVDIFVAMYRYVHMYRSVLSQNTSLYILVRHT